MSTGTPEHAQKMLEVAKQNATHFWAKAFIQEVEPLLVQIRTLLDRLQRAEVVVEAARHWGAAHHWAAQNSSKMLSSILTEGEAAEIVKEYFNKELALKKVLSEWEQAEAEVARLKVGEELIETLATRWRLDGENNEARDD